MPFNDTVPKYYISPPKGKRHDRGDRNSITCGACVHSGPPVTTILSQDLAMDMQRRGCPQTVPANNNNVLVIGGAGSGKTFAYTGPNLMQADSSYVVTDYSGGLYRQYGPFLEYMGYKVRCLNLIEMGHGGHYNPFNYIRSDEDIESLVNTLIAVTIPPEEQKDDPFWEKAEKALLMAVTAYIHYYTAPSQQTFSNIMRLLRAGETDEDDPSMRSALDTIFEQIEELEPESFAVRQYKTFKMATERALKRIIISCLMRLMTFDLKDVADMTGTDDIGLDTIGDEKTALFIIIPTGEKTFNFIAAMLYSQLFRRMRDYCDNTARFSQLITYGNGEVLRCYRADSREESLEKREEAGKFLAKAKEAEVCFNTCTGRFEICTMDGEMVAHRGSKKEAQKVLDLVRTTGTVTGTAQGAGGWSVMPVPVRLMLDEFENIGMQVPDFVNMVYSMNTYGISTSLFSSSLVLMFKHYKKGWDDIVNAFDTVLFFSSLYLCGEANYDFVAKWVIKEKRERIRDNIRKKKKDSNMALDNYTGKDLCMGKDIIRDILALKEDECVVIMKHAGVHKGKRYQAVQHPQHGLVKSLGTQAARRGSVKENI